MSADKSLVPLDAGPVEHVDHQWRALSGVGLSPIDTELAMLWCDSLPWDVVCRTLREEYRVKGYDVRPGEQPRFHLSDFNKAMRRALRKWQALNLGSGMLR